MNATDGQTILTICISALIFFSLGGLAGWLVSLLRVPRTSAKKAPSQPARQAQPTAAPIRSAAENPPDAAKIELARVYQRPEDDQVFLEVNGKPLNTPADVQKTQRTWLVLTAEAIYRLLGAPSQAGPAQPSQPAAGLPPIEWQPSPIQDLPKPSMKPSDVLIRAAQAGQPRLDQPKSLVEQIDAVLQEMLAQSPLPAGEVHLSENAALGLEVRLGNRRYDGIEAVPDANVRTIIRAAIAEWQRRAQHPS